MLLSPTEQERVVGFVINRFRGDIKLLEPGLTWLEQRTNKPVLGVLPYLHGLDISSEDALITQQSADNELASESKIRIIVVVYPHMSNHTDFDVLRHHSQIDCQFLFAKGEESFAHDKITIPACDLIIYQVVRMCAATLIFYVNAVGTTISQNIYVMVVRC
jgi:adenosylcobyric acid synthase